MRALVTRGTAMPLRGSFWTLVQAAALLTTIGGAQAFDESKYPNWKGQWVRMIVPGVRGQPSFDQTRGWGLENGAPLKDEFRKITQDSIDDQQRGGHGNNIDHVRCSAAGMPWMMIAFRPLEFVIKPNLTYILIADYDAFRRVYTDGREMPAGIEPSFGGYSIGRWLDEDGDGKYDVLEVETRNFKGPRVYDTSGMPLHPDNQSVFKERIFLDKNNPDILHDEITVVDNALTRPWTVDKRYVHNADPLADWPESVCIEANAQVFIGSENYFISGDGYLMPTRKGQQPPDTRYFDKASN